MAGAAGGGTGAERLRQDLQHAMSTDAGVMRSAEGLAACTEVVRSTLAGLDPSATDVATAEVRNLAQIALVLVAAATARTESRGTHARVDHPATDPAQRHRLVVSGVPHSGRD